MEAKWTAYKAAITTAVSFDALANGANQLGSEIDNSGTPLKYADFELNLASIDLSAQIAPAINVWLIQAIDGTNYEDGDGTVDSAKGPDFVVPVRAFNGAQKVDIKRVILSPSKFKVLVENATGTTLAVGNTLKYRPYNEDIS